MDFNQYSLKLIILAPGRTLRTYLSLSNIPNPMIAFSSSRARFSERSERLDKLPPSPDEVNALAHARSSECRSARH